MLKKINSLSAPTHMKHKNFLFKRIVNVFQQTKHIWGIKMKIWTSYPLYIIVYCWVSACVCVYPRNSKAASVWMCLSCFTVHIEHSINVWNPQCSNYTILKTICNIYIEMLHPTCKVLKKCYNVSVSCGYKSSLNCGYFDLDKTDFHFLKCPFMCEHLQENFTILTANLKSHKLNSKNDKNVLLDCYRWNKAFVKSTVRLGV